MNQLNFESFPQPDPAFGYQPPRFQPTRGDRDVPESLREQPNFLRQPVFDQVELQRQQQQQLQQQLERGEPAGQTMIVTDEVSLQ